MLLIPLPGRLGAPPVGRWPKSMYVPCSAAYTTNPWDATFSCDDSRQHGRQTPCHMETVGKRIEAIASGKGLPAGQPLAELFGVSYETLRKWRTGAAAPNRERQKKVAAVLGVQPEEFMHGAAKEMYSPNALYIAKIYDLLTAEAPKLAVLLLSNATAFDPREKVDGLPVAPRLVGGERTSPPETAPTRNLSRSK